jgi:hypothetical protein
MDLSDLRTSMRESWAGRLSEHHVTCGSELRRYLPEVYRQALQA